MVLINSLVSQQDTLRVRLVLVACTTQVHTTVTGKAEELFPPFLIIPAMLWYSLSMSEQKECKEMPAPGCMSRRADNMLDPVPQRQ